MENTPTCACAEKKQCCKKTKYVLAWANTVLLALIFAAVSIGDGEGNKGRKHEWREEKNQPLQIIGSGIATDGTYVYSNNQVIWKADPATFTVIDFYYAKDKQYVFELSSGYTSIIPGADPVTFFPFVGGSLYAKDATHVFYDRNVILGADVQSFIVLGTGGYAKDATQVYYWGVPIPDVDAATFQVADFYITGYDAKDKDHLYSSGRVITPEEAKAYMSTYGGVPEMM